MDGILVIDKPQGMTSHDVVDFLRNRFGLKKVGHAGTLDPMATGVLVMLIGTFTKSSALFMADDKEYEATMTLGGLSDTGDAWGKITKTGIPAQLAREDIGKAFQKFQGELEQRPPLYSAIKVRGKKLYEFARKGLTVEVAPRKICIKHLEIVGMELPTISFKVVCSKGTYVRQLAVDIGEELGCGAYLSQLRRTRSGNFRISDAVTVDAMKDLDADGLKKRLHQLCAS